MRLQKLNKKKLQPNEMFLKAIIVLSAIIPSDCILFTDEAKNFTISSFPLFDGKGTKIQKIFNEAATISIYFNSSQHADHVIESLRGIFKNDSKAFVVHNLLDKGVNQIMGRVKISSRKSLNISKYYGFIIFNSFDMLSVNMLLHANPITSFLFIVETFISFDKMEVLKALQEVWLKKRALKVFVLINGDIYNFKPFEVHSNNTKGKLNIFTENQKIEKFKNLNGYSLKIQIFHSAYSILVQQKDIQFFIGPDAEVHNLLQKEMNFTSEYIYNFSISHD